MRKVKKNQTIKKLLRFLAALAIVFLLVPAGNVRASDGFGNYEGFQGNITKRDSYYLDLEKCDIFDSGFSLINGLANVLFGIVKTLAYLTCQLFAFVLELDINALLSEQLDAMQGTFKANVFDTLFILSFSALSITVIKKIFRRDLSGSIGELTKAVVIIIFAFLLTNHSSDIMSACTNITKEVSVSILAGINNDGAASGDFAADAAETLWDNLVHQPWRTLEFGNAAVSGGFDESLVDTFLDAEKKGEARDALVEQHKGYFAKERANERISCLLSYLFPFLIKCLLYIGMAGVQLVFQVMGILFLLLGMIVLVISLIPGYDLDITWIWMKKILDTQLGILVTTMMLGFMIKIDTLLYAAAGSSSLGWFGVACLQVLVLAGLYLCRHQFARLFSRAHRMMSNTRYLRTGMRNSGDMMMYGSAMAAMAAQTARQFRQPLSKGGDGRESPGGSKRPSTMNGGMGKVKDYADQTPRGSESGGQPPQGSPADGPQNSAGKGETRRYTAQRGRRPARGQEAAFRNSRTQRQAAWKSGQTPDPGAARRSQWTQDAETPWDGEPLQGGGTSRDSGQTQDGAATRGSIRTQEGAATRSSTRIQRSSTPWRSGQAQEPASIRDSGQTQNRRTTWKTTAPGDLPEPSGVPPQRSRKKKPTDGSCHGCGKHT